jgi:hypothetical protein
MTRYIAGADSEHLLDEGWSEPLEAGVRGTIRGFIEALLEEELEVGLFDSASALPTSGLTRPLTKLIWLD